MKIPRGAILLHEGGPGDIRFLLHGESEPIAELRGNGDIYVKGKPIAHETDLVDAWRVLLEMPPVKRPETDLDSLRVAVHGLISDLGSSNTGEEAELKALNYLISAYLKGQDKGVRTRDAESVVKPVEPLRVPARTQQIWVVELQLESRHAVMTDKPTTIFLEVASEPPMAQASAEVKALKQHPGYRCVKSHFLKDVLV